MENLIYWQGVAIGIDCGSYISWFTSATLEAINALGDKMQNNTFVGGDDPLPPKPKAPAKKKGGRK